MTDGMPGADADSQHSGSGEPVDRLQTWFVMAVCALILGVTGLLLTWRWQNAAMITLFWASLGFIAAGCLLIVDIYRRERQ